MGPTVDCLILEDFLGMNQSLSLTQMPARPKPLSQGSRDLEMFDELIPGSRRELACRLSNGRTRFRTWDPCRVKAVLYR
jgi:hypothetical protein